MTRLNVSYRDADSDAVLSQTLAVVDAEERVGGQGRVGGEVDDLVAVLNIHPGSPFLLDLIAHSDKGELEFGTWKVTDQDPNWDRIATDAIGKIGGVRLLGCYTALTKTGQAAMRLVKKKLKVPVRGAFTFLSAGDFDAEGFQKTDLLEEVDTLPPPQVITPLLVRRDFERLPRLHVGMTVPLLKQTLQHHPSPVFPPPLGPPTIDFDNIFDGLAPDIRAAPGLLAASEGEFFYKTASGLHRATRLLGGLIIRVYPFGHPAGVLLRRT